jgi:hypothetical protein
MANPGYTPAQADAASWTRELVVPDVGVTWPHTVERYTLNSHPNIRLIFMNLREDGESPKYPEPGGNITIGHVSTRTASPLSSARARCR